MVTVNEHVLVLFASSTAVQVTNSTPRVKVEPEAGTQVTVGLVSQLSVAVVTKVTVCPSKEMHCRTMFVEQTIVGGVTSSTVTVKEQVSVPSPLVASHSTVVVPTMKVLPEAGVQVTVPDSVAEATNVTTAEHWPVSLVVLMLAGHVISGAAAKVWVRGVASSQQQNKNAPRINASTRKELRPRGTDVIF